MAETMERDRTAAMEGELMDDNHGVDQTPVVVDHALIGGLTRAEIDIQIATAHRFRRQISAVKRNIETFATLDQETAEACVYRKPQGRAKNPDTGKWETQYIEGPSARFAEIVFQAWGNCRVATRRTDLTESDLEATGVFHDLESNVAIAMSVRRGIVTSEKDGKKATRYPQHMIETTSNAAASIALRNAILRAVPKGIWNSGYKAAYGAARGTSATLGERRERFLKAAEDAGIKPSEMFEILGIRGKDDISLDVMFDGNGLLNAIRDGETTPEQLLREVRGAGGEAPTLNDAFGRAATKPREDAKTKPPGEAQGSATARTAEPDKDTKGSPTAASTASAAAKSSPRASSAKSEPMPAEDKQDPPKDEAPKDEAKGDVVDFPGDRGRRTAELPAGDANVSHETGAAEDEATGDQAKAPAADQSGPMSDLAIQEFNGYAQAVHKAESWLDISAQVEKLRDSPHFAAADPDTRENALLMAFSKAEALNEDLFAADKVRPEQDPKFYRLWLRQAAKDQVMHVFRPLMRTKAYQALTEAEQDLILDETNTAAGVA